MRIDIFFIYVETYTIIAYRHGGAGNNWALGYEMASGKFMRVTLNCIRRELEACDKPAVLTFIHSLAGGTGSGLGKKVPNMMII